MQAASSLSSSRRSLRESRIEALRPVRCVVGRADDLAALLARISRGARLVTLFGPPGVGKSTLARELVRAAYASFPAGAFELDRDALAFSPRIETLTGTFEETDAPTGRTLIVIDDIDPALDVARRRLPRWLEEQPNVVFVVTSRTLLGVPFEQPFEIRPLATAEAQRLYRQRSHGRAGPPSVASVEQAALEATDGLPRAIEALASGEPSPVAEGWRTELRKLEGDALALLRCAIRFPGGFERSLVVRAFRTAFGPSSPHTLDDALASLVAGSLIQKSAAAHGGEARYTTLRSLRAVVEALDPAPERSEEAFVDAMGTLLEALEARPIFEARARLSAERENLAQASTQPTVVGLRCLLALDDLLARAGDLTARSALLSRVSQAGSVTDVAPDLRARLALCRADVAVGLGDAESASRALDEALARAPAGPLRDALERAAAICERLRARIGVDHEGPAPAHASSADAIARTDTTALESLAERHRAAGDVEGEAAARLELGAVRCELEAYEAGHRDLLEANDAYRALGDERGRACCELLLASHAVLTGKTPRTVTLPPPDALVGPQTSLGGLLARARLRVGLVSAFAATTTSPGLPKIDPDDAATRALARALRALAEAEPPATDALTPADRRLVARASQPFVTGEPLRVAAVPRLRLERTGRWFQVAGRVHTLGGSTLSRRLLLALAARPREVHPPAVLRDAGWPGERVSPRSAKQRLHTAIRRLRRAGLAGVLRSDANGYWLEAEVVLVTGPEEGARAIDDAADDDADDLTCLGDALG
jgi:RecA/RadA recombinase